MINIQVDLISFILITSLFLAHKTNSMCGITCYCLIQYEVHKFNLHNILVIFATLLMFKAERFDVLSKVYDKSLCHINSNATNIVYYNSPFGLRLSTYKLCNSM